MSSYFLLTPYVFGIFFGFDRHSSEVMKCRVIAFKKRVCLPFRVKSCLSTTELFLESVCCFRSHDSQETAQNSSWQRILTTTKSLFVYSLPQIMMMESLQGLLFFILVLHTCSPYLLFILTLHPAFCILFAFVFCFLRERDVDT